MIVSVNDRANSQCNNSLVSQVGMTNSQYIFHNVFMRRNRLTRLDVNVSGISGFRCKTSAER